ncbi:MAG: hypothetical protein Q9166_001796 [cf. Caloplaca sp. 2 TL-2023]
MDRRSKSAETITGPFARTLIEKAGLLEPGLNNLTVLDNACGTGVVASALNEMMDAKTKGRMKLTLGDLSEPMLKVAKGRSEREGWGHTDARIVNMEKTGLPDATFSHVPPQIHRILKPGGTSGFTTWSHVDWVADIRAAVATLPGPPPFPDDVTMYRSWGVGDWHSAEWIRKHLSDTTSPSSTSSSGAKLSHFTDIQVEELGKDLVMSSPEVFMDVFSVMVPSLLKKFWSEEQRMKLGGMVVPTMLEYMNGKYGEGKEVRMHWVANFVVARKPFEEK